MFRNLQDSVLCDTKLPGHPYCVAATVDGNWLLVSIIGPPKHAIAVLRRGAGVAEFSHLVPLDSRHSGLALSESGDLLAAAAFDKGGVTFLDVERTCLNEPDAILGHVATGGRAGSIQLLFSKDDQTVFVAEEKQAAVSVINLSRATSRRFSSAVFIGHVPVDHMPVGVAISPDGAWLYVTCQATEPTVGDDISVHASKFVGRSVSPRGTVTAISISRAQTEPADALAARVPAGLNPVRVALSHEGRILWVTARASDELIALDAAAVHRGEDIRRALVTVGTAPIGVAVVANDTKVVVANSNFSRRKRSNLTVVQMDAALAGQPSVLGTIDVGQFPREFCVDQKNNLLFLSNYRSQTLTVLDVGVFANERF